MKLVWKEGFYTRNICILLPKAIAIQSGWLIDHWSWFTSASALYAKIGSDQKKN